MPELPEVETIRRGLENLLHQKIHKVLRSDKKLRIPSTLDLSLLKNKTITGISRRARYLIIDFSDNYSLIIHLGMSGSIVIESVKSKLDSKKNNFHKKSKDTKHDHFICEFEDARLIFNDPRRFGFVDLVQSKNIAQHKMLKKLGPEPLSAQFEEKYLAQKLRGKKMNIKTTMMDNEIVVGVGNIYINESLFESRISPLRAAASLSKSEISKLVKIIKNTLQKAIELGGSSINDYVDSQGKKGGFQKKFKVYGQEQKECLHCKNTIIKIVQNSRSSFYCKNCQK